jgi:hypothetical protein
MGLFFITFGVLLLVVVGMSVGAIFRDKPLKGSCGGVAAALGEKDYTCDICGDDPNKCEEQQELNTAAKEKVSPQDLGYDASQK